MLRVFVQSLKIVTIVAVAVLVGAGGLRVFDYTVGRFTPEEIGEPVSVTIEENENADVVAERLVEQDLIRSKFLFTTQMQVSRQAFTPGTYQLRKGMSAQQIIDRITRGETELVAEAPEATGDGDKAEAGPDLGGGNTFEITIPEGWRIEQIAEEYEKQGGEGGDEAFMDAVADVDRAQYPFLADLPNDAPLEGFLFPNTYVASQDDPSQLVASMLDAFSEAFPAEAIARSYQMNLDPFQVVTFASLVEKEAQLPEERPVIAQVYLSRYEQQADGWKLEADPTVQYAVAPRDGDWWGFPLTEDDLFFDSPYNTYQNAGLPPGPIASPGKASLQAVLEPAPTDYMFFVAKGDTGEHAFAVSKEEHDANVAEFQLGEGSDG